jgi:HEAT repeat protein
MSSSGWPLAALGLLVQAGSLLAQGAPDRPPPPSLSTSSGYVSEVGGKTLEKWMRELKSPDPSVRTQAIMHVVLFGESAARAVPLIIDRCRDHDPSPRVKAVIALKLMHVNERDVPRVVEALTQRLMEDGQQIVRYEAAAALLRFGEASRPAVGALARNATDLTSTWELRHMSIVALRQAAYDARTGPDPRATRALMGALSDPVAKVRLEAVVSLAALGRPSEPRLLGAVIHQLQGLQASKDKSVALWSYVALMGMDEKVTEKSLQAILRMLRSPESDIRQQVLTAIAAIGTRARSCVPDVLDAIQDRDAAVVAAACSALGRMGDRDPKVIEALITASQRKESTVVWAACQALGELGLASPEVMAALEKVSQRKELDDMLLHSVRDIEQKLRKGDKKK